MAAFVCQWRSATPRILMRRFNFLLRISPNNSKPKTKFSLDGVLTVVDVLSVAVVSSCLMHVLLSTLLLPLFLLLLTSLEFCWLVSLLLLPPYAI
jgi:hypothetical protein